MFSPSELSELACAVTHMASMYQRSSCYNVAATYWFLAEKCLKEIGRNNEAEESRKLAVYCKEQGSR